MKIPESIRWKPTGKTLGEGGQAPVYEVIDKTSGDPKTYALKALRKGRPQTAYLRFVKEVQAIKELSHPSIIKIIDHSEAEAEFHYYVMEYIPGAKNLKALINTDRNPFYKNPKKSLDLFIKLLEAIKVCEEHELRIVHRDISPANILILPDESIRVIDFGLCQIENQKTITLIDEGVGTPNYMAPECESGSEEEVTSVSDIYSAGKILWSAISNLFAFARESPAFTSKSMQSVFPDDPITWHLQHVFKKTIRFNAENRWKSAAEALAECKKVSSLIVGAYPPIEKLQYHCPICGYGDLEPFHGSHMVFVIPNPTGMQSLQCNYCGYCFTINTGHIRRSVEEMKEFD